MFFFVWFYSSLSSGNVLFDNRARRHFDRPTFSTIFYSGSSSSIHGIQESWDSVCAAMYVLYYINARFQYEPEVSGSHPLLTSKAKKLDEKYLSRLKWIANARFKRRNDKRKEKSANKVVCLRMKRKAKTFRSSEVNPTPTVSFSTQNVSKRAS